MAEGSRFWTTNNTGDGPTGGYSAANFNQFVREAFLTNPASEGVLRGIGSNLAVSGASSPVAVAAGSAIVYGFFYFNDASLNVTIPTPTTATRIDRIVLRVSWAAQTVRVTRIAGTEGAGAPALVQTANTTWDIPLAQVSITTGGAITLTDQRDYVKAPGVYGWLDENVSISGALSVSGAVTLSGALTVAGVLTPSGGLAANSIATAAIQAGAITAAKIAAGTITAAEIAADAIGSSELADNAVDTGAIAAGAVTTAKIADANVTTAKIADANVTLAKLAADSVDDTKAGDRVLALIRRQGGSGTDWNTVGGTAYTPGAVRAQAGSVNMTFGGSNVAGPTTITFPVAFSAKPLVFVEGDSDYIVCAVTNIAAGSFQIICRHVDSNVAGSRPVSWFAIGPE